VPYRSRKICNHHGCGAAYEGAGGYCEAHKALHARQVGRDYEATRRDQGKARFERGGLWRKIRAAYLAHHTLCEDCVAEGRVTIALDVHHIDGDYLRNDDANLRALCRACHNARTARGE